MSAPLITMVTVIAIFGLLFAAEKLFPLRQSRAALWARVFVNATISALAFLVAALVVRPSAVYALDWASGQRFGLVHLVRLPDWLQLVLGFLFMDLSFYYWHVLNHRVPLFWRFHNVHHIDPELDVSTGFRFHFGEVLFSTVFRVLQVTLVGVSFGTFAMYELAFQANTLFHHSNLRLPIGLERCLNLILVTPRMHGIHHSQVQREADSNYGVVFPWWDRLHRTLGLNIPQSKIEIGVPAYTSPEDNQLWRALAMPFVTQRDYWRKRNGVMPIRAAADRSENPNRLEE